MLLIDAYTAIVKIHSIYFVSIVNKNLSKSMHISKTWIDLLNFGLLIQQIGPCNLIRPF